MRDWRSAISAPLTYRIGSSTVHFRSHLLLVSCTVTAAVLIIGYLALTGRQRSVASVLHHESASNLTYPPSAPVRLAGATKYRIAVVEDPDTASRAGQEHRWESRLRRGSLTISDPPVRTATVEWEEGGEVTLSSGLGAGGRGMELSELSVFHGKLVTVDDRTGVVYRVVGDAVVPWVILADGDGSRPKGLKAEWSTVRAGELWVGGLGKEWTTPRGELASLDPMWVKVVGPEGAVRHIDWSRQYKAVRAAAGVEWPGYMIHEAVCWSQRAARWVFLPRRVSKDR
jgi:soluble calcium-activated nucleotidase 1